MQQCGPKIFIHALLLLTLLGVTLQVRAQSSGEIRGVVLDETGAVIEGARINVFDEPAAYEQPLEARATVRLASTRLHSVPIELSPIVRNLKAFSLMKRSARVRLWRISV